MTTVTRPAPRRWDASQELLVPAAVCVVMLVLWLVRRNTGVYHVAMRRCSGADSFPR